MGDSVEYREGVFVATGPHPVSTGQDSTASATTGTALLPRPDDHLVSVATPATLMAGDVPPGAPGGPTPSPAPAAGGARRIAVATIVAALIAAMAFGAAAFGGAFNSGNGGTPTPGSARGALGAAAANSAGATSVAFTVSATRSTSSTLTTLASGSGAVDLSTDTGRLTATVPALAAVVGSGDDSVDVISDGSSLYLGSPALSSLTGSNRWIKATLPKGSSGSAGTSSLSVLADPSQLLGLLSAIGGKVTTVGSADIDGTQTTEYRTTVTVAELADRAGVSGKGSSLGAAVGKVLGQLGNSSIPVTAWVGTDGYVRQLSASIQLSSATLGSLAGDLVSGTLGSSTADRSTTATTVTVGFSNYGAPVNVAVPPASQVTDVSAIVSSVQGVLSQVRHAFSGLAAKF